MYAPFPEMPPIDSMRIAEAQSALESTLKERDDLLEQMKMTAGLSFEEHRARALAFMHAATFMALSATVDVLTAHITALQALSAMEGSSDAV